MLARSQNFRSGGDLRKVDRRFSFVRVHNLFVSPQHNFALLQSSEEINRLTEDLFLSFHQATQQHVRPDAVPVRLSFRPSSGRSQRSFPSFDLDSV
jgi:hypothetical protein